MLLFAYPLINIHALCHVIVWQMLFENRKSKTTNQQIWIWIWKIIIFSMRSEWIWHLDPSMCIMCSMFICLFTFLCRHWVAELYILLLSIPLKFQGKPEPYKMFSWQKCFLFLPSFLQYQRRSSLWLNIIFTYDKNKRSEWDLHDTLQQSVVMVTGIIIFINNCVFVFFFFFFSPSRTNHWHSLGKGLWLNSYNETATTNNRLISQHFYF